MVDGLGRSYTTRYEEWVLSTPVHESEVDKAWAIMKQKAAEHDAPINFVARDGELAISFGYTLEDDRCSTCHKMYELNKLHACLRGKETL